MPASLTVPETVPPHWWQEFLHTTIALQLRGALLLLLGLTKKVALADYLWRGKRDAALEGAVTSWIANAVGAAPWAVFLDVDDIATDLAQDAPRRLHWLAQFTAEAA